MVKPSPGPEHQPADQTAHDIFLGVVRETSIKGFEGDVNLGFEEESKRLSLVTLMLSLKRIAAIKKRRMRTHDYATT
jgi:hypothetical protein